MTKPRSDADRLRRRELYDAATGLVGPRLLPWTTPDGCPCYLSTDGRGYLSTLADSIEAVQLGMGEELLEHARETLAPGMRALSATEYRWLASRLAEALTDALRVAESRGQHIPVPQEEAAEHA
ncbi:hypothetical protein [Streptomyces sp. MUM 178J]|uniref:hypothetical protein n=1 Tax=Streptomyces sp. MUM 178J TaxID=2791991 RepID=UPI001F043399|nr:hypothetical protein [Streptomyces sp. MUM 178J]WRQ82368.1 hypothetical protein I3F59_025115 [Streptomyces sp. MUM 178J]